MRNPADAERDHRCWIRSTCIVTAVVELYIRTPPGLRIPIHEQAATSLPPSAHAAQPTTAPIQSPSAIARCLFPRGHRAAPLVPPRKPYARAHPSCQIATRAARRPPATRNPQPAARRRASPRTCHCQDLLTGPQPRTRRGSGGAPTPCVFRSFDFLFRARDDAWARQGR
ncbi:hypothetical protein OH77DRAFT_923896 [Trametes cingulata]|nr:hypothetical protein OH77DRAFT_923896 [Trametes cingulata]